MNSPLPFRFLLFFCYIWMPAVYGQTNIFKEGLKTANPIAPGTDISLDESIKIHEKYLNDAIRTNDLQKQMYGCVYLYTDFLKKQDYSTASKWILEAEKVGQAANNFGWLGIAAHLKGVIAIRMRDFEGAILPYKQAAALCGQAGDSLCLAESLEQIGSMYFRLSDFEKGKAYFDQAMPLLEKYGNNRSVAIALNNTGLSYFDQGRFAEAVPYFKKAIPKFQENEDRKETAQALNNLAATYLELKQYQDAIDIYDECLQLNTASEEYSNLMTNFSGLAQLYEETGNYPKALKYFHQYQDLRDSLIGAKTEKEIAELQLKYESQEKELALQKSQAELANTQRTLERQTGFILFGLLLVAFGFWRWRIQANHTKLTLAQHQIALQDLTRLLVGKNALLAESEPARDEILRSNAEPDFEDDFYNQRILTNEDWEGFKAYFEKAYPGYLRRLRNSFPTLSEAEERLFLFIKLNLTTREAASILGITVESIKKTRNRLRHRLELDEKVELEVFIRAF